MANASTVPSAQEKEVLPSNPIGRPRMATQQSNSLPSTPRQRPRDMGLLRRTPSPGHRTTGGSPRSASSESMRPMPALRLNPSACRFMSTQTSRRRIPYNIGTDLLPREDGKVKASLEPHEEKKLSGDMRELYDRLLPPTDEHDRRKQVVKKLQMMLSEEWPEKNIHVSKFGSSGNLLYTSKSDVDVCVIMTGLETTCALADALARRGMQKVTCVHAKGVPIVKIWDPELKLACDLNLNNHVALTNTKMVKTYMQLDERVRPLAMIVKHWTKRRVINEASGGTLSSYTWTLLLINFLQTRRPPILPVLELRERSTNQPRQNFSEDLSNDNYRGFGEPNKETIGELLFHFFRRYGYEIDYKSAVISVRKGRLMTKEEKNWQLATNNMLCVEEPFNTDRNLGNTADDTAFRGLHLEFRQAFDRIAEGKDLDSSICEQFHFPTGETKSTIFERPTPQPRPILTRSHSQTTRGGASGGGTTRGHRHQGGQRNSANGRRASSAAAYGPSLHPWYQQGTGLIYAPEYLLQAQPQELQAHLTQQGLRDHLSQLTQRQQQLSREEQRLRLQQQLLLNQAQIQQAQAMTPGQNKSFSATYSARSHGNHNHRSPRNAGLDEPPATAPLLQTYHFGSHLDSPTSLSHSPGTITNPSSPSLNSSAPFRRGFERAPVSTPSATGTRSQSQPARPIGPQHLSTPQGRAQHTASAVSTPQAARHQFPIANSLSSQQYIGPFLGPYGQQFYIPATPTGDPRPREYIGYGYGGTPQFVQAYPAQPLTSTAMYDDLIQPTQQSSSEGIDGSSATSMLDTVSRTSSPLEDYELVPDLTSGRLVSEVEPLILDPTDVTTTKIPSYTAPLIVNGSSYSPAAVLDGSNQRRRASDSLNHNILGSSVQLNGVLNDEDSAPSPMAQSLSALPLRSAQASLIMQSNGTHSPPQNSLSSPAARTEGHKYPLRTLIPSKPAEPPPPRGYTFDPGFQKPTKSSARLSADRPSDLTTNSLEAFHHIVQPATLLSPVRESPGPSPIVSRDADATTPHVNGHSSSTSTPECGSPLKVARVQREEHPPPTPLSTAATNGIAGLGITLPIAKPATIPTTQERNGISSATSPEPSDTSRPTSAGNTSEPVAPANLNSAIDANAWQVAAGRKNKKRSGGMKSPEIVPANAGKRKGG